MKSKSKVLAESTSSGSGSGSVGVGGRSKSGSGGGGGVKKGSKDANGGGGARRRRKDSSKSSRSSSRTRSSTNNKAAVAAKAAAQSQSQAIPPPPPSSYISTAIMRRFERLAVAIDGSLDDDDDGGGGLPGMLCSSRGGGANSAGDGSDDDDNDGGVGGGGIGIGRCGVGSGVGSGGRRCGSSPPIDTSGDDTAPTVLHSSAETTADDSVNERHQLLDNSLLTSPTNNTAANRANRARARPDIIDIDINIDDQDGDGDGGGNNNFASWLASQEFDASAIFWNGDDVNPRNLNDGDANDDLSFRDVALAAGSDGDVDAVMIPEFSGDGMMMAREEEEEEEEEKEEKEREPTTSRSEGGGVGVGGSGREDSGLDCSGYVSLTGKKARSSTSSSSRRSWLPMVMPSSISEAWGKVAASNWQCWEVPDDSDATNADADAKAAIPPPPGACSPCCGGGGGESNLLAGAKFDYEPNSYGLKEGSSEASTADRKQGHHRRMPSGGSVKRLPSILKESSFDVKVSVVRTRADDDHVVDSRSGKDDDAERRPRSDYDDKRPKSAEEEEVDAPPPPPSSSSSSHVLFSPPVVPTTRARSQTEDMSTAATSVATPLFGEDIVSSSTPVRLRDDYGVVSYTYSASPGDDRGGGADPGRPAAAVAEATATTMRAAGAFGGAILTINDDSITYPSIHRGSEEGRREHGDGDGTDDDVADDIDDDERPLMHDHASYSSAGSSSGTSGIGGGRWSKVGRRRRRMRLSKK